MRLLRIVTVAALLALAGTTVALATSDDHGRRLAGPFCVHLNTGVLRVVAVNQPCKAHEIRKVGLAVPDIDPIPVIHFPVPKPGATGLTGATGPPGTNGINGTNGSNGSQGPAGQVTVTQLDGDQAGCVRITGSDGSSGVVCAPPCNCKCDTEKPPWSGGYDSLKPS